MVNTRRMESNGLTQGPRHRTRGSLRLLKRVEVQESGSSSVNESDTEDSADKDTSSNGADKSKEPIKKKAHLPSRQLRSKFSFTDHKYKPNPVRRDHKRISLDQHTLVYARKMRDFGGYERTNDTDDEEEVYAIRSRRSRHLIRMNRIQRRTALSLRPISQKCYADPRSPLHFNTDSEGGVRRSKRKRQVNMSWLADSQMHKVGYPNLHAGYSEEDSRDAVDVNAHNDIEITRRVTRKRSDIDLHREAKKTYIYDSDNEEMPPRRRNTPRGNIVKKEMQTERESNDKENNKDHFQFNGRLRSRKSETFTEDKDKSDNETVEALSESKETIKNSETKENGEHKEFDNIQEEPKQEQEHSSDSEQDQIPLTRLRTSRTSFRPNVTTSFPTRTTTNFRTRTTNKYPPRNNRSFTDRTTLNEKDTDTTSSEEEEERRPYSLRDRRPKAAPKAMQTSVLRPRDPRTRRRRRRLQSSSSSDSTSSDICRSKPPKSPHSKNEKMKLGIGSKIMPIKPEKLDGSVRFNSIGGLDGHVQCLKEMILLPMMYPEVFRQFQVKPPRGVLFHGPPGTGKTLIARALANECSFGMKKVAFFMRKGADLLSKWIGESEKQLRLLFQQAADMKPSIIFFDELDGLAPVRSSRQDQIHASIVSTLLALMDGLDDRGEIIVIGATNRIDAIDPALRRPGRFDRELFFPLPNKNERIEILKVHVSNWFQPPTEQLLDYLAENTVGYCGSDLRALCTEAVIQSFRRTYPQVYNSEFRLQLNPENVKVEKVDFLRAKSMLLPASQRITQGLGRKLFPILEPILQDSLKKALGLLEHSFPHGLSTSLAKVKLTPNVRPAQLLITADGPEHGQTIHLAPAILFKMEHIHSYLLDLTVLYKESGRSAEEACIQTFNEARRNIPSIIYIPSIDKWWDLVNETVRALLIAQLSQLDRNIPILLLATADKLYDQLPEKLQDIFSLYRKEVMQLSLPSSEARRCFYKPLLIESSLKQPRILRERPKTPPLLPRAPTPPPSPMTEQQKKKLYEKEEHTLRELRIFLRDMCKKLANNKLFFMFTKPVDTEEVPDYTTIIKQPMDLETMMTKVDFHRYESAKDFLNDIELICQNALEYNPARTSADKQIRHRACSLRDYAYTLIKTEMDTDFEDKCQEISTKRRERKHCPTNYLPPYIYTPDGALNDIGKLDDEGKNDSLINGNVSLDNKSVEKPDGSKTPNKKRKRFGWQKGILLKKKRRRLLSNSQSQVDQKMSSDDDSKENEMEAQPDTLTKLNDTKLKPIGQEEQLPRSETAPLSINCDKQSCSKEGSKSPLRSPKRRLSDLLSPSELLDNPLDFDDVEEALNETVSEEWNNRLQVDCSSSELEKVLEQTVKLTEGYSLLHLLDLYNHLSRIIKKYSRTVDRVLLPKDLSREVTRFKKEGAAECNKTYPPT